MSTTGQCYGNGISLKAGTSLICKNISQEAIKTPTNVPWAYVGSCGGKHCCSYTPGEGGVKYI